MTRVPFAAALAAAVSMLALTYDVQAVPQAKQKPIDTSQLRRAVDEDDIRDHQRELQEIADENNGTRASGTPGFDESADYVVKQLKKAGYRVTRQVFDFP